MKVPLSRPVVIWGGDVDSFKAWLGQRMGRYPRRMCRSIKKLRNPEAPASDEEIRAAALQFVRKVSGFARPSRANSAAFERAVEEIAAVSKDLLGSLQTAKSA